MSQIEAKWVLPFKIITTGVAGIAASHGDLLLVSPTGASTTVTLPTAIGNENVLVAIKDTSGNLDPLAPGVAKTIIITPALAQTIDGLAGLSLESDYEMVRLISDGANWFKI